MNRSRNFLIILTVLIIYLLILLSWKSDKPLFALFRSTTNPISTDVYGTFTCETRKNFPYINIQKYEDCLKWRRNEAFWPVQGLRHTSFKKFLNSSSLIIEVGGNIGEDTDRFIELYNSSIITFEPLVSMANDLIKKFQTNSKIKVQPYGLSNRARNVSVEPVDKSNMGTSIFRKISSTNTSTIQQIQLLEIIEVIENIRNTKTQDGMIDMISINCEGCEFEILPALILNNLTQYFRIIQFGTHIDVLANASCIYCQIEQSLERTHQIIYHYSMLWEAWILKNK